MGIFFKSKEEKLQERLLEEEGLAAISRITVSTLPSIDRPYEILGVVCSSYDSTSCHISDCMHEIKADAYTLGADAVIGITFQTSGETQSYQVNTTGFSNHAENERHVYSRINSRAVGTAIKYIKE